MKNECYDWVFIGAGCSSMQLLERLSHLPDWREKNVALFSDGEKQHRSWCFWSSQKHHLDFLVKKTWQKVNFVGEDFSITTDVTPYTYSYIPGEAFFDYFNATFCPDNTNITKVNSKVIGLEKLISEYSVTSEHFSCRGKQVFNSTPPKIDAESPYFSLKQHFKGWFIKTDEAIFDDSTATLMDFSIEQKNDVRFMYFLPFSPHEALVEMTAFSPNPYTDDVYDACIEEYLNKRYDKLNYQIEKIEKGSIPMTNAPFSRFGNAGDVLLGAAAGMVKATTGYAFNRIGKDSAQIATDLAQKRPLSWRRTKGRFRYYDTLLLGILTQNPEKGKLIFESLFKKTPMTTIFRFLDEETTIWEEIQIFKRLPILTFIKQVIKQLLR